LSFFTATTEPAPFFARTHQYVAAVSRALQGSGPIHIEFEGVTASPAAVLIQGFPNDSHLNELRDRLRDQLRAEGLGNGLDERYRLETVHITAVRFRAPLRQSETFAAALERARHRSFGSATVRSLSLVKNDWYMSRQVTETVRRYRIPPLKS
jgi:2'-5' RNA ligase